jgi:hypothetical protein
LNLMEPAVRDEALLEDIATASAGGHEFRLWWQIGSVDHIYDSGCDTVLHPTLVTGLRAFRIDVALLPINGRNPDRE